MSLTLFELSKKLKEAQKGNQQAYKLFLSNIVQLLRRQNLSEEVIQNTLIRIHKARHCFQSQNDFSS